MKTTKLLMMLLLSPGLVADSSKVSKVDPLLSLSDEDQMFLGTTSSKIDIKTLSGSQYTKDIKPIRTLNQSERDLPRITLASIILRNGGLDLPPSTIARVICVHLFGSDVIPFINFVVEMFDKVQRSILVIPGFGTLVNLFNRAANKPRG